MWWASRYRLRNRVRTNLWLVPAAYTVVAIVAGLAFPHWDHDHPLDLGLNSASIQTALNAIATGMIAFTGLVFSGVMLVVQFGSSTFSTRLMRWFWRSLIVKNALGVFVATFVYSLVALASVDRGDPTWVPTQTFIFALVFVLLSVGMFLALLDRLAALLRVARVTRELGRQTLVVIAEVYPEPFDDTRAADSPTHHLPSGEPHQIVSQEGEPGSIMAIDRAGLIAFARKNSVLLHLIPAVGEHVGRSSTLFHIYGDHDIDDAAVRRGVVSGEERTIDSDPSFGFRLLVDIALKALSAAVNDPTTAVQVLDRLEDLLLFAAHRQLQRRGEVDEQQTLRLVYSTPSWDDLLRLALEEIRVYGAGAPQVTRRVEALLDRLLEHAPPARRPKIEAFRRRLHATVAVAVLDADGREFAMTSDRQGIGPGSKESATASYRG